MIVNIKAEPVTPVMSTPKEDEDQHSVPARTAMTSGISATERQHRTRNVLAVMRSVFTRTVENGTSLEDVAAHYQGRFDTIAPFLSDDDAESYDLENLVWNELLRFPTGQEDRVEVSGPAVRLPHAVAQPVTLALHELVTNAVKFGALDAPDPGRVAISWAWNGAELVFEWRETGVSIVRTAPPKTGFGREFIEQGLPYQIDAQTTFDFEPGGVVSTIRLPLDRHAQNAAAGTG